MAAAGYVRTGRGERRVHGRMEGYAERTGEWRRDRTMIDEAGKAGYMTVYRKTTRGDLPD